MPTFNYVTHANLEYFKNKVNSSYLKLKGSGDKPSISNIEYYAAMWRTTEDTWNASYDANPSSYNNGQLFRLYSQGDSDKQITDFYISDGASDGVWVRSNWNAQNNSKTTNFTGWKRIPLATEIPINLSELGSDTTHRVVTDSQILAWNNKSDFSGSYNDLTDKPTIPTLTSQLTNDSGFIDSNGGTISGIISRSSGGSWISARDNVVVKQTKSNEAHNGYNPIVGVKTQLGFWSLGSEGGESLCLSYDTDIDYNNGTNNNVALFFPLSAGTIALTSDITSALNGYATQTWVENKGYITSSAVKDGTLTLSKTQGAQSPQPSATFSANQSSNTSFNVDDLAARFHLGKYDSVVDNGDGTSTITRNTGYLVYNDFQNPDWAPTSNTRGKYIDVPKDFDINGVIYASVPVKSGDAAWASSVTCIQAGNGSNDARCYWTIGWTTPIYVQYKSTISYTQTVPTSQPLLTLDQNGCNFVRNQWEKTQQLWSGTFRKDNNWHVYLTNLNLKPNTTYFIKSPVYLDPYITVFAVYGASGSKEYWRDVYSYKLHNGWAFTTPSDLGDIYQIYLQFSSQYNFSSSDLVMLNEGDHAYPYSPFNQKEHITNAQAELLKQEEEKVKNIYNKSKLVYINGGWCFPLSGFVVGKKYSYNIISSLAQVKISTNPSGPNTWQSSLAKNTFTMTSAMQSLYFIVLDSSYVATNTTQCMLTPTDTPQPYTDYYGEILHEVDLKPTLLWENANPNSNFATQTVTDIKDMSRYKYIIFAYKWMDIGIGIKYDKFNFAVNGYVDLFFMGGTETVCRNFQFKSSTSGVFGDSYHNGSKDSTGTYIIPIAIYGTNIL